MSSVRVSALFDLARSLLSFYEGVNGYRVQGGGSDRAQLRTEMVRARKSLLFVDYSLEAIRNNEESGCAATALAVTSLGGNFFMAGVSFSGIASGLDTESLIKAASSASRQIKVTPLQKQVQELTETNDALDALSSRLLRLRTQVTKFSSLLGGPLEKSATTSNESVLTATANRGAPTGSYEVVVSQLAKNGVFSFNDRWSDTSSVINSSINNSAPAEDRTVKIAIGLGSSQETISLELTNTTTPADLVASFNARATKGVAMLVNVGSPSSPSYAMSFTATSEGTQDGTVQLISPTGSELSAGAPVLQSGTTQAASDAQFSITGITGTITRSSNTVTNIVQGLSFNLRAVGTSTLTVRDNSAGSAQLVRDFVDQLNGVISYSKESNKTTQEDQKNELVTIFGPLTRSRVDEGILGEIRSAIASTSASSGSSIQIFADLGITTQRDGTFGFDEDKYRAAIAAEPTSVDSMMRTFGDTVGRTGGTIDLYTRFSGLIDGVRNANKTSITDTNKRISEAEKAITKAEEEARSRYARFESMMGNLQTQGSQLSSILASIGK